MAEAIQACERTPGEDICPFHPGHKITSLCKTCGILVCMECILSSKDHEEHLFKKISECLREPTNKIARYLSDIENNLLAAVDRELASVQRERKESVETYQDRVQGIKDQGTNLKTEIDKTTNTMVVQMDKSLQEVLVSLDKHIKTLESLRKYLLEERKECSKVLHGGSPILKFDVGNAVTEKAEKTRVPKHPNIPDLQHVKCENSAALIKKALGTLQELNHPGKSPSAGAHPSTKGSLTNIPSFDPSVPTPPTPEHKTQHRYSSVNTHSTWSNEDPGYYQVTPITNDTAWAGMSKYDKDRKEYVPNTNLQLITSQGKPLCKIETEDVFQSLSQHPTTGQLYGGFVDKTIRSIDTESGTTTVTVQCDTIPDRIKVTKDNDVLIGTYEDKHPVYRYKLTGKLVHTSPEKYEVYDIDQCTKTNRVVLSCGEGGVMILNQNLTMIRTFTGLTGQTRVQFGCGQTRKRFYCFTALFDSYNNLIVGDAWNKEIYILDGDQFNLIQKLPMVNLSLPIMMKMYSNRMWVECKNPNKVMCIDIL